MNIFSDFKNKIIENLLLLKKKGLILLPENYANFTIEIPKNKIHGDLSSNAPMVFAKINNTNPLNLANTIRDGLVNRLEKVTKIEIVKPGFINFFLNNDYWHQLLLSISENYGKNPSVKKNKILLEFVSANPTGPLHVGHCRGAVFGDVLGNLLKFSGNEVVKEYYVNDYGNQINNFVKSVYSRILEIKNKIPFPNDQDLYPGEYIIDIAKNIIKKNVNLHFDNYELIFIKLKNLCIEESMILIKNDLNNLGIIHDSFVSETKMANSNLIEKVFEKLKINNFIYKGTLPKPKGDEIEEWEPREQLLFKSTIFGDDSDRALKKSDGSWTYFANDVVYHYDKISRNFDLLINILGADHAGYLKRQISCVNAMSDGKQKIISKVCQLVKLFKSGKQFKMSKRAGDFITANDLIKEVGKDSVRFMMLYRNNDSQLDFDFDLVSTYSKENPVFYVQYAHARISSIFNKLNDESLNFEKIKISFLSHESEIDLIKKISEWPKCIDLSCLYFEPHRIPFYLYELASLFHSYWSLGNEDENLKVINSNKNIQDSRLFLLKKIQFILATGLKILNVNAPLEM